jgi:glycerophosphoryl diester phosphodiesterase
VLVKATSASNGLYGKLTPATDVIGHRGAAADAPENTMPSFDLAAALGAGCVEHDVQVTGDGTLVCLHDRTLERTTNVRDVFPDRGRLARVGNEFVRHWYVHDFTLAEIQQLDAGSWFRSDFAGTRVPTFDELLAWASHRIAVLTELKEPDVYASFGVDMLALCEHTLRRHGLVVGSRPASVTVQSFDAPTVRRAAQLFSGHVPSVLLIEPEDAALLRDRAHVAAIAEFAAGIGPEKSIVADHPAIVEWAHDAGLRVTPWTFRAATIGRFASVEAEMQHHLIAFGVDAVITDHPRGCRDEPAS